jgi:2-methylisocitrate lyase-like PEP mutase family enzyme
MSPSIEEKRAAFRGLHEAGCFVLPNAWDRGSARYLASLGFPALASTSSGSAWAHGRADGTQDRDTVLAHLQDLVGATDLPVNADFEHGYAASPDEVAENVRLAAGTGVAGISIEDSTGDPRDPLYPREVAAERMRAAREGAGPDVVLVGRAEGFIAGRPDLDDVLVRLRAYADAGADCLYAPGITTQKQIAAVVEAVAPKPVNLLVGGVSELTIAEIATLGVRRVSVGGALARAAWSGLQRAAQTLAREGRFDGFADAAAGSDLNAFFAPFSD